MHPSLMQDNYNCCQLLTIFDTLHKVADFFMALKNHCNANELDSDAQNETVNASVLQRKEIMKHLQDEISTKEDSKKKNIPQTISN